MCHINVRWQELRMKMGKMWAWSYFIGWGSANESHILSSIYNHVSIIERLSHLSREVLLSITLCSSHYYYLNDSWQVTTTLSHGLSGLGKERGFSSLRKLTKQMNNNKINRQRPPPPWESLMSMNAFQMLFYLVASKWPGLSSDWFLGLPADLQSQIL